jgi:hypothetical protein
MVSALMFLNFAISKIISVRDIQNNNIGSILNAGVKIKIIDKISNRIAMTNDIILKSLSKIIEICSDFAIIIVIKTDIVT